MLKRIAMISEHASPLTAIGGVDSGGQNVYVAQVARHLARLGYEIDVFTRRDDREKPVVVEWMDGIRIVHVPAGPPAFVRKEDLLPWMDDFASYMIRWCERDGRGYDLMHANFWMSGLIAAETKRALGIPFVITFHALGKVRRLYQRDADEFPVERIAIEERVMSAADAIIAECPQDRVDLIELYDADPTRIQMIPAGYDPAEFSPVDKLEARQLLGLAPDERIVLQLGRMVPRKGIETVIRGVSWLVHELRMPARLLVVGGESDAPDPRLTPEIGRLQKIAREEGIADRVVFAGRRGRTVLKYYYSAADVFATLPWYEPFGMTPLEAMGCATPVIGSRVGGIQYTVQHGKTGYLVPPQNPEAFAERLAHLFQHPELMTRFGQQGLRRARDLFSWDKIAMHMARTYEGIPSGGVIDYRRLREQERDGTTLPYYSEL